MLTYQQSRFWPWQSCSQPVDGGEGAFAALHFAAHEQLWLTYKAMQPTAGRCTAPLHFMKTRSFAIHARSRQRWLILFSLGSMRPIAISTIATVILLAGCGALQLSPVTNESRAVHGATDATKIVTVPEGMVWYDGSPRTRGLRFPAGRYTLEAEDADYWYLRSPAPLEFRDFTGGQPTSVRNLPGGIMMSKRFSIVPAAGYIEGEGTTEVMVWKLGQEFLQLEGKAWTKSF